MLNLYRLAEKNLLSDHLIRIGIKQLCKQRLTEEFQSDPDRQSERIQELLDAFSATDIAENTEEANEQHYEIPSSFYDKVLGKHKKYSASIWQDNTQDLTEAEENTLQIYRERAELDQAHRILDLGCGWGSLSLWLAEHLPNAEITSLSNSTSQGEYIRGIAKKKGLDNIKVITGNINEVTMDKQFDRIVSIEMFEHIRNYNELFKKLNSWLTDDGKLFVHIFCHRYLVYPFETEGNDNWMGRYFFTGGIMPSSDTLLRFQGSVKLQKQWLVSGKHYQKTSEAWLKNMDAHKTDILDILKPVYGKHTEVWIQRWRIFFMACAELFGFKQGSEWIVSHYLFQKA